MHAKRGSALTSFIKQNVRNLWYLFVNLVITAVKFSLFML